MRPRVALAALVSAVAWLATSPSATRAQEPPPDRDERLRWWRDARFGMLVHFGLYSTAAGEWKGRPVEGTGEWLQFKAQIPADEYAALLERFDPARFDAREWVALAKDAGMKYVVVTAKHHDGFALFDSRFTEWDVTSTPFRRDLMKELSEACREQGLAIGWYYSILDWHHPDYLPRGPGSPRPWDARPLRSDGGSATYDRYVQFMKDQLGELLSSYGRIDVLWFDGGWEHTAQEHRAEELIALARRLQPRIVINDRLQVAQDFVTPEQYIPTTGPRDRDWETCMTMNDTWGFHRADRSWKPAATLIRCLVEAASKGGNFLLNVGPTGEGVFPPESVERLAAIGRWMRTNGESIHGTSASPFRRLAFGRCTVGRASESESGRTTLYLHVFDWPPDGVLRLPGLKNSPVGARVLGDPERAGLLAMRDGEEVKVVLSGGPLDPADTVVALEIAGRPDVASPVARPAADGTLKLEAIDADVHGVQARFEGAADKQCIGFWTDAKDFVSWQFELSAAGRFTVLVEHACDPASAGAEVIVALGRPEAPGPEQRLPIESTGAWNRFVARALPEPVELAPGRWTLTVKPAVKPRDAVMNLRSVTLAPVP